jgi:tungstate transport system permease protein
MNLIWEAIGDAAGLVVRADPELMRIAGLSLLVSGVATAIAAAIGIPLGVALHIGHFPGRGPATTLVNAGMAVPPVVVGLLVYLLLSRAGPLGFLAWLFTPSAMVLAQTIISLPLIAGFTMAAVQGVDPMLRLQIQSLGATPAQATRTILWEARAGVTVAVVAGFGSIISEVGAVMLVGGNIEGETRVLTTAIVLQTRMGAFDLALALSFVLLAITFALNGVVLLLQGGVRARR